MATPFPISVWKEVRGVGGRWVVVTIGMAIGMVIGMAIGMVIGMAWQSEW